MWALYRYPTDNDTIKIYEEIKFNIIFGGATY